MTAVAHAAEGTLRVNYAVLPPAPTSPTEFTKEYAVKVNAMPKDDDTGVILTIYLKDGSGTVGELRVPMDSKLCGPFVAGFMSKIEAAIKLHDAFR